MSTQDTSLRRGLRTRDLTMMGLGSAIGAGLFLGTGVGIKAAGPAVLLAYAFAGFLIVCVMQMLGEMAAARPSTGSFAVYGRQAFGHWAGFSLTWLYWFMLIMVLGAEMTGAAAIMGSWFNVDQWIPAAVCILFFAFVNLFTVRNFGRFEFWFALVKVIAIVAFLIIGVLLIFGLLPGHDFVGTKNYLENGFMPNGLPGVAAALLAVAFAFGGIEIIAIASAEAEDPQASITAAVRSVIWRIAVFYIGSTLVISFLLPFSEISGADSAAESPFALVLAKANIPGVVFIMEAVIVVALLSAFNAQIYASSRMAYSAARNGDGPAILARTNSAGAPQNAVALSVLFAFGSGVLQYWNPPGLLEFLLNAVGGILVVVWIFTALAHLKLHNEMRDRGELTTLQMWGYPWLPILTILGFVALTVLMLFDATTRAQIISVVILFLGLVALSFTTRKKAARVAAKRAAAETSSPSPQVTATAETETR